MRLPFVFLMISILVSSCTTYDGFYRYTPKPLDTEIRPPDAEKPIGRALVSIVGVRREPAGIEVALRLENFGEAPLTFDPAGTVLLCGDLEELAPSQQPEVSEVPTGDALKGKLFFPFPPERRAADFDLEGLNFRWKLIHDGRPLLISATFERLLRPEVDVHYPYPMGWHGHFTIFYAR